MKIDQDIGFVHKSVSNNYGFATVEIRGTGFENSAPSYIKVNGVELDRSTSRGFTLVRFTREMTLIDVTRYDVWSRNADISAFTEKMYEVGDNMYFAVYSYDAHQDVEIISEMGGDYYKHIKRNFGSNYRTYRTPYCCFGTGRRNQNNVPTILYESLGRWEAGAVEPYAVLNITVGDPEVVALNQTSDNYLGYMKANNSNPLRNVTFSAEHKHYEFKITGRNHNASTGGITRAIISVNDVLCDTITLNNELFQSKKSLINCEIGDTIRITYNTTGQYEVTFVGMFGKVFLNTDSKSQLISNNTLGCRSNKISLYGYDYADITNYSNIIGEIVTNHNSNMFMGDKQIPVLSLNGSINSGIISIDPNKNYALVGYIKGNNANARLSIQSFNGTNLTATIINSSSSSDAVVLNKTLINRTGVIAIPIYRANATNTSKFHSGFYLEDGNEIHSFSEKPIIRRESNTDGIRINISGNMHVSLKLVEMTYTFHKDGTVFGNFNLG